MMTAAPQLSPFGETTSDASDDSTEISAFCRDASENVHHGISAGCAPSELRKPNLQVTQFGVQAELNSLRRVMAGLGVKVHCPDYSVQLPDWHYLQHPDEHYVQDSGVAVRDRGRRKRRAIIAFQAGDHRRRAERDAWIAGMQSVMPDAELIRLCQPDGWFEAGDLFAPIDIDGQATFFAGIRVDRIDRNGPTIRTVERGIAEFAEVVSDYGYRVVKVPFHSHPHSPLLHFTTGGSLLPRNANGRAHVMVNPYNFDDDSRRIFLDHGLGVLTPRAETPTKAHLWAVNCLALDGNIIFQDYPEIRRTLLEADYCEAQLCAIPRWQYCPQHDGSLTCTVVHDYVIGDE